MALNLKCDKDLLPRSSKANKESALLRPLSFSFSFSEKGIWSSSAMDFHASK